MLIRLNSSKSQETVCEKLAFCSIWSGCNTQEAYCLPFLNTGWPLDTGNTGYTWFVLERYFILIFLLGGMPPSNGMCPAFLFLTIEVCWTLKIGKSHQMRLWQEEVSDLFCHDSLFDVRVSDLSVLAVNIWCQKTSKFSKHSSHKPCNRNICWTCCKWVSLVKSNFDRHNQ